MSNANLRIFWLPPNEFGIVNSFEGRFFIYNHGKPIGYKLTDRLDPALPVHKGTLASCKSYARSLLLSTLEDPA